MDAGVPNEIAELAGYQNLGEVIEYDPTRHQAIITPDGHRVHSLHREFLAAHPSRARGTITVETAAGFVTAVARHTTPATVVYAHLANRKVVAVLNDDTATEPGWRDHRVELTLPSTTEWKDWVERQDWQGHAALGEFFDAHVADFHPSKEPTAAAMVDLASTCRATAALDFTSSAVRNRQAFNYNEESNVVGGSGGNIEFPDFFYLAIRPFTACKAAYEVTCRLRARRSGKTIEAGYWLDRLDDTLRAAFEAVLADIRVGLTDVVFVDGEPPRLAETFGSSRVEEL